MVVSSTNSENERVLERIACLDPHFFIGGTVGIKVNDDVG
jgi:hypothetical protein